MTDEKQVQEQADEKQINEAFQELLSRYLESKHRKKVEIITKAFNFARQAHKGVRRRSGEPYILHPIAVARIACVEIGLGSTSICSALLHDVVEDTDYTVEDIENLFGPKIAQIVDGLTKISALRGGLLILSGLLWVRRLPLRPSSRLLRIPLCRHRARSSCKALAGYLRARVQEISDITRNLKIMAKELNVPIICLSQLSRNTERSSNRDHRPMLSDLRDSGSIEQDADSVLFLYREAYYDTEGQSDTSTAECIVAKNRHGEVGTVNLGWDGAHTRFMNIEYNRDADY